jgi:hypothetical protein
MASVTVIKEISFATSYHAKPAEALAQVFSAPKAKNFAKRILKPNASDSTTIEPPARGRHPTRGGVRDDAATEPSSLALVSPDTEPTGRSGSR